MFFRNVSKVTPDRMLLDTQRCASLTPKAVWFREVATEFQNCRIQSVQTKAPSGGIFIRVNGRFYLFVDCFGVCPAKQETPYADDILLVRIVAQVAMDSRS
jgi:hypothetical protein